MGALQGLLECSQLLAPAHEHMLAVRRQRFSAALELGASRCGLRRMRVQSARQRYAVGPQHAISHEQLIAQRDEIGATRGVQIHEQQQRRTRYGSLVHRTSPWVPKTLVG